MKHTIFKKIISPVMAIAVVFAFFSFKIEQHFCGSNLVDVSMSKIESCCAPSAVKGTSLQITKQSCCSNISIVVEGFDNYQNTFVTEFISLPSFVASPSIQIPVDYIFETIKEFSYSNYNPPPLVFDVQVRDQVFII